MEDDYDTMKSLLRKLVEGMEASVDVGCTDHLDCWDDAKRKWYLPLKRAKQMLGMADD